MTRRSPSSPVLRALVLALLAAGGASSAAGGCNCNPSAGAPDAAPVASSSAAPAASASASAEPNVVHGRDEIKPVYPRDDDALPPEPLAQKYCQTVHTVPIEKQRGCCPDAFAPADLSSECTRTLSYAVRHKAIVIDAPALDACVEAMKQATATCDWVGGPLPMPSACTTVFRGQLKESDACRSSLECADGARCQGVGAVDQGKCLPPRAKGYPCELGVEVLASNTRQSALAEHHPECTGHCVRRRCEDVPAEGGACKVSFECGPKGRCVANKCTFTALPKAGEACSDGQCAEGARCVAGKCAATLEEGAKCTDDGQCKVHCEVGDAGKEGVCAKKCPAFGKPGMPLPMPKPPPPRRK